MAGRRVPSRRPIASVQTGMVEDERTQRALDILTSAVQGLQAKPARDVLAVDLAAGLNKLRHGLGHAVTGYSVALATPDATFSSAIDTTNPRPDLEVWVTTTVAAKGAKIEVY